jgi:hypothetical protein
MRGGEAVPARTHHERGRQPAFADAGGTHDMMPIIFSASPSRTDGICSNGESLPMCGRKRERHDEHFSCCLRDDNICLLPVWMLIQRTASLPSDLP